MTAPRVFISYSWTSAGHQQWVLDLATQLRENGVEAILDKWDLREGQDATVFMERMVTDESVQKVVMIFDRVYAEKADKRTGGVGTEAQIISSEVYSKVDQTKFVGVASELDADGKSFSPTYYKSRIYIDLSSDEIYPSNFEQLLRWIFDKPLHIKPTLGKPPEFLRDDAVGLGTNSRARHAKDHIQNIRADAVAAFEDYLVTFADEIEKLRITTDEPDEFDDRVIKSISDELPYRNEYIEILTLAARYWNAAFIGKIHKFFESLARYEFKPASVRSWHEWDFDNFRFINNELFLYTIAILIRSERFMEVGELLGEQYYLGTVAPDRREPMVDFTVFSDHLASFEHRNQRLSLRRLSLQADLTEKRSHGAAFPFEGLMQADFILYLRDLLTRKDQWGRWRPETLVYANRMYSPFEVFARARSKRYLGRLLMTFGVESIDPFNALMTEFNQGKREPPRWEYDSFNPLILSGWDKLGSIP